MLKEIYIIQNDSFNIDELNSYFKENNYFLNTSTYNSEVFNYIKDNNIALVIIDLSELKIDHIDLLINLREIKHNLPVIMINSKISDSEKINALEAGVDDYLYKPVYPRELIARIKNILRKI